MSNLSTCIIYLNLGLALLHANNCKPRESNLGKYYTPLDLLKYGAVPSLAMVVLMSFTPYYLRLFGL